MTPEEIKKAREIIDVPCPWCYKPGSYVKIFDDGYNHTERCDNCGLQASIRSDNLNHFIHGKESKKDEFKKWNSK